MWPKRCPGFSWEHPRGQGRASPPRGCSFGCCRPRGCHSKVPMLGSVARNSGGCWGRGARPRVLLGSPRAGWRGVAVNNAHSSPMTKQPGSLLHTTTGRFLQSRALRTLRGVRPGFPGVSVTPDFPPVPSPGSPTLPLPIPRSLSSAREPCCCGLGSRWVLRVLWVLGFCPGGVCSLISRAVKVSSLPASHLRGFVLRVPQAPGIWA